MKLCEKLVELRRAHAMTQEELAERLDISRQAVSRWEMGSAMPDAANILQLAKLFGVTTDYLLFDDYQSDADLPPVRRAREDSTGVILIYLVTLEVMIVLIQILCTFILQNLPLAFLGFAIFVAPLGGFEAAYRRNPPTEATRKFRLRFYKISAWLGLFVPTFFLSFTAMRLYPHPHSAVVEIIVALVLYIAVTTLLCLAMDKANARHK